MLHRKISLLSSILIAICFIAGPSLAEAKPQTKPSARSGLVQIIQNPKLIRNSETESYDLQVAVVIPKSLHAVWTGDADAWLVIWNSGQMMQIQLTGENADNGYTWSPDHPRNLITITAEQMKMKGLQTGDYQIGLVLTQAGTPDPIVLSNWYGGFSGLVSVARLTIHITLPDPSGTSGGDSSGEYGSGPAM